jgi:L-ascorbate metabolism protein UlaG (beta-lactamase superfamily)
MEKEARYRLADSTVIEPLVNYWSAWSHLISPVPASLHLTHHQLKTLQSYLEDPAFHVRAARDPEFAGGPFSEIPVERADEMRDLLASTLSKQSANLTLASTVKEFHNLLVDEARGQSMEPFYERVPDDLRGYVELVYDYYHNPTVRFFEGLLYESKFYDKSLQSLKIFQVQRDNSRPFFMSTPRLPDADHIDWQVSFDDARIDRLFRLDRRPQPLGSIREILGLGPEDDGRLLPLLSEVPQTLPDKWRERQVRIRYCGHACVLLEWNGISLLTDPYLPVMPVAGGINRFSYQDLPEKIDYALVTHNHQDHFALETLLRLRERIGCLVVPKSYGILYGDISLKLMAQRLGFKNVVELDTMESIGLPDGEIIGAPFLGEHGDLAHGKIAYVVRAGTEQVLFAADSDCLDKRMYERLRHALGPIETVFLGTECVGAPLTWHCGALFPRRPTREQDQTRRYHGCDSRAALDLLEGVGAKRIYNYAMGKEPWLEHLLGLGLSEESPQLRESGALLKKARARGFLAAERPYGKQEIYLPKSSKKSRVFVPCPFEMVDEQEQRQESAARPQENHDRELVYWKQQLGGVLPKLELPTDGYRLEARTNTHNLRRSPGFVLPASLAGSLRELGQQNSCSLSTTLLAAFQTLLYRYTGQDDIILGALINGGGPSVSEASREAKLLVLRTDLSGEPSFQILLGRTREVFARACAHGRLPFDLLLRALRTEDGSAHAPIFQVMFVFEGEAAERTFVSLAEESALKRPAGAEECELVLHVSEDEQGVNVTLEYDAALFDADTIKTMLEHYEALLDGVASSPETILHDLPLESGDEQQSEGEMGNYAAAGADVNRVDDIEDQFAF